jgi:hypothetical protein
VQTQSIAVPRITRDRAVRLIHAYASRASRILRSETRTPDEARELIDQTRRTLSVRLWHDVDDREFWELVDNIAELRQNRATEWGHLWNSPEEKAQWLGRLRQTINDEVNVLSFRFREA